jgi:hypothetical protein
MAPRPILSTIAGVEIALAVLIVALVAIGFGIQEPDDIGALALTTLILAGVPVASILLNRSDGTFRTTVAAILVVSWLPLLWWVLVYA